ncbi:Phosphatidylinositol Kinase [Penicillium paradoxum]|uniref:Phosphatidylinositol Kinase n=1 Tax=Penicillium paradoxum TaxID=176176 RepID=UPI0025493DEF|nr:Phosphatidylinositol Kinase [Penicillium paradoxum]KAJ5780857.1 Phosphatidylinositol Kinase [Penicillium paradoxum]
MDGLSGGIRRLAFQKLAALAVEAPRDESELTRLADQSRLSRQPDGALNGILRDQAPISQVPMGIRELDVLLALCKAASSVNDPENAARLMSQLSRYLPESHSQLFRPSPFLHSVKPSPWETLTYNLVIALLSLGTKYPDIRTTALRAVHSYLNNCTEAIKAVTPFQYSRSETGRQGVVHESLAVLSIAVSLVGFMEASAEHTSIWHASEKLQIVDNLRAMLSEPFIIAVETASSTIRNANVAEHAFSDWRKYTRRYAAHGRPLGAMLVQEGFMRFVKSCAASLIGFQHLTDDQLLDDYMTGVGIAKSYDEADIALVERVTDIISEEIHLLEDGSDYLQVGSPWQQRLAFSVKGHALVGFLNCVILGEDLTNNDMLLSWLEDTLLDPQQMSNVELSVTVLKCTAILARMSPNGASIGRRCLLRFLAQGGVSARSTVAVASRCLAQILTILSEDAVITTLYSLGNALSPSTNVDQSSQDQLIGDHTGPGMNLEAYPKNASQTSLSANGEDDTVTYRNVIHAIVTVATHCNDGKISALAQSMLLQKIGKINITVDAFIIQETAVLALSGGQAEFQLLLKFYARIYLDGINKGLDTISDAVQCAMAYLSITLDQKSPLHRLYLVHLLESIINKGDVPDRENERHKEIVFAADDITPLLKPLALLLSSKGSPTGASWSILDYDETILTLFRDAWFNIAIHGISLSSSVAQRHHKELRILAHHSPPLVAENHMDSLESDVELNTVLRRGMGPQRVMEQKKALVSELPGRESDIKRLDYSRAVFLNAVILVESLRASSGDSTKILSYFLDPALATPEMVVCTNAVADKAVTSYLSLTLSGEHDEFSAPYLSKQLAGFLVACCHRIERVQSIATQCADKIIRECPSALCEKHSLFALLEILTVMWSSCLQGELDEFEWKPSLVSPMGIVKVELPDNYALRRATLNRFHERARTWVTTVLNIAPLDIKGLLQTYLSEYDDDGGYGHISMGRSFALEMGSLIPQSDPRLGSIDGYGSTQFNVASDFMALYTTRQKYRRPDMPSLGGLDGESYSQCVDQPRVDNLPESTESLEKILGRLYERSIAGEEISVVEVRNVLRQAAGLICSSSKPRLSVVHYLVALPFQIFTKETIKLGVSLWLGVIHENPSTEPRILCEVIEGWERSMKRRKGLFDPTFEYLDPLHTRIELLPTDKDLMLRMQQKAQDTVSPHLRVLHFFESHFNAIRLGNLQDQQLFCRLISSTVVGLSKSQGHPLAREIHFRIVLLGLRVLRHLSPRNSGASWKLKDQILSAALSWFRHPPRWSFGGNRLQIKAEDRILSEVTAVLRSVAGIAALAQGSYKSLQPKQELLQVLVENERSRLRVWLFPLEPERKHHMPSIGGKSPDEGPVSLLRLAWAENAGLAIQMATRFPSTKMQTDIRSLILNFPEKVIEEPSALEIMFDNSLPADVGPQLKYMLYWAPVTPTEAITYFMPAYGNHPYILQYAMRALESYSMDVRFYFVPQLVQALRFDALGYVDRYILETTKLSQLFAHQVIWNMKANSFKDEDSQIPDPIKDTLDRFLDNLISSFSDEERAFYEREFSFFNEVTGVSGKLRPYIKRSKPEKKEKIEEELRKIKVEVGVYLPSNPDGVVVGIDRKSGKPLQSHAKAPYMATFRIQKTRPRLIEKAEADSSDHHHQHQRQLTNHSEPEQETYEVWQSAIFKVGDDCRQDMLALQMIAAFRSIFTSVGLDVWVYPYRVTSTAPGCGVIDVLPNSISRDMLGREAVNGLYDYFVSKYGGEDSIKFQEARTNFVKSMAAYSVISYLLQFKDRHNGNIMIDDAGHIIHIDFGFCFDIAPGGVRFERAPFKLTSEMVAVMSGTHDPAHHQGGINLPGSSHNPTTTQPYRWFESLVVKAFLASRPYSTKLAHIVSLMLDSGLPCFKPETLKNFRDRFVLDKSERDAAEYMRELTRKSYMSVSTKGYDQFQLMTNGIPY